MTEGSTVKKSTVLTFFTQTRSHSTSRDVATKSGCNDALTRQIAVVISFYPYPHQKYQLNDATHLFVTQSTNCSTLLFCQRIHPVTTFDFHVSHHTEICMFIDSSSTSFPRQGSNLSACVQTFLLSLSKVKEYKTCKRRLQQTPIYKNKWIKNIRLKVG